jgi:hypothetical protein
MNRAWLPWLLAAGSLLALLVILSLGTGRDSEPPPEPADGLRARNAALEREVAELREEVRLLRGAGKPPSPAPERVPTASSAEPSGPEKPEKSTRFGPDTVREAYDHYRTWLDAIRQIEDADLRSRTVEEVRRSFTSEDDATLLGGLFTARGSAPAEIDRRGWRDLILPHVSSSEPLLRRAALRALLFVAPDPADLVYWIEEAKSADRQSAETAARSIVKLAGGRVEGAAADAVLGLLRPGTDIKAAFVMRGLSDAKVLDSRVQNRLLEIVRKADPGDYDSHYFFHFLARNLEPKSDALMDLILDRAAGMKGDLRTVLSGLRKGLDAGQRARAAERLIGLAENASSDPARAEVLRVLVDLAGPAQVARLEAIASDPDVAESTRKLAATAAKAARARN